MAMKHGTKLSSQFELFLHRLSGKRENIMVRRSATPERLRRLAGWLASTSCVRSNRIGRINECPCHMGPWACLSLHTTQYM